MNINNIKEGDSVVFIGVDINLEKYKVYIVGRVYENSGRKYYEISDTNYDVYEPNMSTYFLSLSEYRYQKLQELNKC